MTPSDGPKMRIGINAPNWLNNGNVMGIHNDLMVAAGPDQFGPWRMHVPNGTPQGGTAYLPDVPQVGYWCAPEGVGYSRPGMYTLTAQGVGAIKVTWFGAGRPVFNGTLPNTSIATFAGKGEKYTFTLPSNCHTNLTVTATDGTNALRSVQLLAPGAGPGLYHPEYLASLQPFDGPLRYMDAVQTVGSVETKWADRNARPGENLESLIALAKQLGKDIWICLPHRCVAANGAPTDYPYQLGDLLNAIAPPSMTVYLEYSDEVWNYGNPFWVATSYVADQGAQEFTPQGFRKQYATHAWKAFQAVASRIGPYGPKLKRVFAGQLANVSTIDQSLAFSAAQGYHFDALAGGLYWTWTGDVNAVKTAWTAGDKTTALNLIDQGYRAGEKQMMGWVATYAKFAKQYGMDLVGYEGGPAFGPWNDPVGGQVMRAYVRDPLCKKQHLDTFGDLEAAGVSLLVYYSHRHPDGTWSSQLGPGDLANGRYRGLLHKIVGAPPAQFTGPDAATKGSWGGVYGALGSMVAGAPAPAPAPAPTPAPVPVAPATVTAKPVIYAATTADPRALQVPGGSTRVSAAWNDPKEIDLDVPAPGAANGGVYLLGLYFCDFANWAGGITQQVQVADADSGAVLDTQTITGFSAAPVYLRWAIESHVKVKITRISGGGAVLSGVFLDPCPAP